MKRAFAILLALMLVLSLATPAFAADADTTTISVDTTGYTDRTFNGYMIMSVTNDGTAYNYIVAAKYYDVLEDVLNLDFEGLTSVQVDKAVYEAINGLTTDEAVRHFANDLYRAIKTVGIAADITGWNGTAKEVDQGYWLIADVTEGLPGTESNSLVILDTAGDSAVSATLKTDVTKDEKKVDDENDSIAADIAGNEDAQNWQDTADYDIGDKVPYQITGQLANDVAAYSYYSFAIVDTVSAGLDHLPNTATETNIQLYLNGQLQTIMAAGETGTADWIYEINGKTLTIYPNYGYTRNDGTVVEASATNGGDFLKLFPAGTDHAEISSSTFTLLYNCLLNENAVIGLPGNTNDAKVRVSNNPYGDGFGETPVDTTITFTYQFKVDKVDPKGQPLTGAEFALYKFIAEGKTPYTGTETVAASAAEAAKNGTYFNHPGANSYGKFVVVDRLTVNDEGTEFTFKGIDDGYYVLVETVVPDGYKAINPVEFHVIANHVTDLSGTTGTTLRELYAVVKTGSSQTISGDTATGTLTAVIENHTGTELPSTGGMGTTLFYVLGGLMAASAMVLLVTKKRMSVN